MVLLQIWGVVVGCDHGGFHSKKIKERVGVGKLVEGSVVLEGRMSYIVMIKS